VAGLIVNPTSIISEALRELPERMTSCRAQAMMLAIGLQESRFVDRRQVPVAHAMGFWQFERAGGVRGVMTHRASRDLAEQALQRRGLVLDEGAAWRALADDDVLAAIFARLLLWTDPQVLPALTDPAGAWDLYVRVWRPGKPHPQTWQRLHQQALGLMS